MKTFVLGLSSMAFASAAPWVFAGPLLSSDGNSAVQDELPTVEIIGTTTLSGVGVPLSQFPANAQILGAQEAKEQGVNNLADLLNNHLGSVSISNGTGNGYQNDINYRGFQATSVLGAPVGLSVFFDGVRMNEPFGSIVNWDLIPVNAMSRLSVLPGSNPLFGLNTLGGALVIDTKNGLDNPGGSISMGLGSFNRKRLNAEWGLSDVSHGTDYFFAANLDRQDGYRLYSGTDVKQLYGKARWRGNGGSTHLELSGALADTSLSGTQALPQDMLADPRVAYTWPDNTANRMSMISLKGKQMLDDTHLLSGQVYFRKGNSHNLNSNANLDDGCFNDDGSLAMTGAAPKCANKAPNGTALNSVTAATPNNALGLGYGRWTSSIHSSLIDSLTRQETVGSSLQWSNFGDWLGKTNSFTWGGSYDQSKITYDQNSSLARLVNAQAALSKATVWPISGHRRRIEQHQGVVQAPTFSPGFLATAGHIENELEQLHAHFFNRLGAIGNRACVDVHEVVPAAGQV
jgi:hypothetical protein